MESEKRKLYIRIRQAKYNPPDDDMIYLVEEGKRKYIRTHTRGTGEEVLKWAESWAKKKIRKIRQNYVVQGDELCIKRGSGALIVLGESIPPILHVYEDRPTVHIRNKQTMMKHIINKGYYTTTKLVEKHIKDCLTCHQVSLQNNRPKHYNMRNVRKRRGEGQAQQQQQSQQEQRQQLQHQQEQLINILNQREEEDDDEIPAEESEEEESEEEESEQQRRQQREQQRQRQHQREKEQLQQQRELQREQRKEKESEEEEEIGQEDTEQESQESEEEIIPDKPNSTQPKRPPKNIENDEEDDTILPTQTEKKTQSNNRSTRPITRNCPTPSPTIQRNLTDDDDDDDDDNDDNDKRTVNPITPTKVTTSFIERYKKKNNITTTSKTRFGQQQKQLIKPKTITKK